MKSTICFILACASFGWFLGVISDPQIPRELAGQFVLSVTAFYATLRLGGFIK